MLQSRKLQRDHSKEVHAHLALDGGIKMLLIFLHSVDCAFVLL